MKENIISVVNRLYGIDGNDIFNHTRKKEIVQIRYLIFYFLRENRKWTFRKIGEFFNLDHATVIYGANSFKNGLEIYKKDRINFLKFQNFMENKGPLDKYLLAEFINDNEKYLSNDLKEYLKVRL
ncbi:hypothetical protein MG290_01800 [Flavobacterium sp. CBA20B-1]|uniref:helix-turn-helix domain-containing protein n=1 Tax=unclassified Flavobacterium TaxID=196869 RepID=UPI002225719D|nr:MULTISPECIES: helix-turn-helix domain-containing protein [unclassified Flavobacterium]WCM42429.1 hypothetical protein MG290_01800 [Flavobacterium sp. CBA20B-1]